VRLASRGLRDMDNGPQVIADQAELQHVRQQARRVYVKAFVTALVLTAIAVIL
jgi:hypothetical protein